MEKVAEKGGVVVAILSHSHAARRWLLESEKGVSAPRHFLHDCELVPIWVSDG